MGLQQRNWPDRPPGMRDVFPQQARRRRDLENQILAFFEQEGFELVSSGAYEYVDTLERGRQAQDAQGWLRFFDASGRPVALRPEMTPSIARMAAPLLAAGRGPIRWCYAERVYHRAIDKAILSWTSGRPAESTQVGVELIGEKGVDADCDLLSLLQRSVTEVGVSDWQMVVSHAAFTPAFLGAIGIQSEDVDLLLEALAVGDYVGFRRQCAALDIGFDVLAALGALDPADASTLHGDYAMALETSQAGRQCLTAWDDLTSLAKTLQQRGLQDGLTFDLTLHRDITYYTGIVFEVFAPGVGAPIALGGRYDDLLAHFGTAAPAIGFTFEAERLLAAMDHATEPSTR